DDLELGRDGIVAVLRGESESFVIEKRYVHRDGSLVWARISAAAVRDEEGRALYLVSHTEDITARRRAEAELREREAAQDALRDVATAVASGAGPAAVFRLVASRVQHLFGVQRAAVTRFDRPGRGTMLGVHPELEPSFVEGATLALDEGTATGRVSLTG